jgi:glutamate-ammonia-ligase adenylyltransferase
VKLGPGGLVDLEFSVQVLQLTRQIGLDPRLGAALEQLVSEGLIERKVIDAQQLLTRMLVMMRLVAPGNMKPTTETCQLVAEACGASGWDELLAEHHAARQSIAALWNGIKQGIPS